MDQQIDSSITVRNLLINTGLQAILDIEGVSEIAINQPGTIHFDRGQGWESQEAPGATYKNTLSLARALSVYSHIARPLDVKNPIASVILPAGERGQIILPPATEKNCVALTIRKPSRARYSLDDYEASGRFARAKGAVKTSLELTALQQDLLALKNNNELAAFIKLAIPSRLNILIVGSTGSGKTTVMKAMVDHYPQDKRIFTIEDVHEVDLPNHPNHVHLYYQEGGVTPKQLIRACMRKRPDHVMLAELTGDETWSYLELLNTGHTGSITTIHANDCYSAYARLASLVKSSEVGMTLDYDFILRTVKTSIDVVCFFDHTYLTEIYYDPQEKNRILSDG